MNATAAQNRRNVARILRPTLLILGLGFFAGFAISSREEIFLVLHSIHWATFCLGILLALLDSMVFTLLFRLMLEKHGMPMGICGVGQMYFLGQIAKYIPGRVWNIVFHTTTTNLPGSPAAILAANVDLTILGLLRNTALPLTLLLLFNSTTLALLFYIFSAVIFVWIAATAKSAALTRFIARLLPTFSSTSTASAQLSSAHIFLLYLTSGATLFLSYYFVMSAVFDFAWMQTVAYIAIFMLAWVMGALAFLVPGGLGVRELAFVVMASHFGGESVTGEVLAAIAVVFRIWQLCHEAIGALLGLLFRRFS